MEKYCAYLRKSRADRDAELRGEGETLARHKELLLSLAQKLNIHISQFYCEVVSGENIDSRPEMKKLLHDVENGKWTGVLVVEVERLARGNTKDQGIVADSFKYSDTKIITLTKTYDPQNEFDEEYFEFGLFMSRREYKTINRRLQRGRISSANEGKWIASTAPYGYRRVKIPREKGYTLEILPEQADVVLKIFSWYCYGENIPGGSIGPYGTDAIAAKLDALGIKPLSSPSWSKATISDMLKNRAYAGYVEFGKQKELKSTVDGKIVKMRKSCSDHLVVKGLHPAIIDESTFELAQTLRLENRKNTLPSSTSLQNPLSGIVYCQKCGRMMTRLAPNSRNSYSTMKCPNRYCHNVSSPLFLVEEQLLSFLKRWLDDYTLNNNIITVTPLSGEISCREESLQKLYSDIDGLKAQMSKVYTFLEQGVYTIDVFRQRQTTIQNEIARLESSASSISAEITNLKQARKEQELFVPRIKNLLETYHTNSVETNNRILREIVDRAVYNKDVPNRKGQISNANFTLEVFPRIPI